MAQAEANGTGAPEPLTPAGRESAGAPPPAVGVGTRLLRSAGWVLAGTVLSRALTLLSSFVVARMLGREGYGELGIIQSTLTTFQLFASFGLGLTATKYVAQLRTADPARAGRIIGLSHLVALGTGGAAAAALAAGSGWLAREVLAAPQLGPSLAIAALVVLLYALNGAQVGALSGFEAFRDVARINVVSALATLPLMLAGVWLDGVRGAVCAMVGTAALNCVLSNRAQAGHARRHGIAVVHRGVLREGRILWAFTVPAVLAGLFVQPVNWICNALLVNQPGGYAEMGVFSAATQWRTLLNLVPVMMMQAVLPVLSSSHSEGEATATFQRSLRITQSLMVGFAFPVAVVLMFGSGPILALYGAAFRGAEHVLIGVVCAALIQCVGAATGTALEARGRMWMGLAINASWGVLYLVLVRLTVARWGAAALVFSQAVAYATISVWGFLAMKRDLPPGMLARMLASILVVGCLTAVAALTPRSWRLPASVPVLVAASGVTLSYLMDREIVSLLFARMRRLWNGGGS